MTKHVIKREGMFTNLVDSLADELNKKIKFERRNKLLSRIVNSLSDEK